MGPPDVEELAGTEGEDHSLRSLVLSKLGQTMPSSKLEDEPEGSPSCDVEGGEAKAEKPAMWKLNRWVFIHN